MGDAASGYPDGAAQRRRQGTAASSVLTPPSGMPVLPDLETSFPTQRQHSEHSQPLPVQPPAPPVQRTVVDPCTCGHAAAAHDHYRPGTDCGTCGRTACGEYRPENTSFRRLMRKFRLLS